jgi:hypothetical protein
MNTNLYKSTETSITKNGVEITLAEAASELQELSRVSYRLECDKINLTATAKQLGDEVYELSFKNKHLEKELDRIKQIALSQSKLLQKGIVYTYEELIRHDAEVIEKAIRLYGRKTLDGNIIYVEGLRDYANQLRQKAQDESK